MIELISYARFVDSYSLTDLKLLIIYNRETCSSSFITLKKVVNWNRIKCRSASNNIFNNIFSVPEDNYYNSNDQSTDTYVNNFISSSFYLRINLILSLLRSVKSHSLSYLKSLCFTKTLINKYKLIKKYGNIIDLDVIVRIIFSFKILCHSIRKKCNLFRKEERQKWINIGCKLAI